MAYEGYCLVVDMDSTIVARPSTGSSPPITESPCYEPMLAWLAGNGRVVVVTSAGLRAIRQVGRVDARRLPRI